MKISMIKNHFHLNALKHFSMSKKTESTVTTFENLSNELLYEIFDYFDFCFAHETFSSLNYRFYQLFNCSTLPISIRFENVSKTLFYRRCQNILFRHENRLKSLQFVDHFHLEYFLGNFSFNSNFIQLQRLFINRMQFDQCFPFLLACETLPSLENLSIEIIEQIKCPNRIFDFVFRLTHLQTFRLVFDLPEFYDDTSSILVQTSPIKSLSIDGRYHLDDLIHLLNLTPKLESLKCSMTSSTIDRFQTFDVPLNLHSIDFILENISFDEFEWFISSFSQQIDKCSLTIVNTIDFLNCQRWEHLLKKHLSNVVRFCFHHHLYTLANSFNFHRYHELIDEFSHSSFFSERHIAFAHQHYPTKHHQSFHHFYSIESYRAKEFAFIDDFCERIDFQWNFAEKILIYNFDALEQSAMIFPRATSLTYFDDQFSRHSSFLKALPFRLNPRQINEFVLIGEQFRFEHLTNFLDVLTNLKVLRIPTTILHLASPKSKTNSFQFRNTTIKRLILSNLCQFADVQIVTSLFHFLHSLEIEIVQEQFSTVLAFLLRHYFKRISLCSKSIHRNIHDDFPSCFYCKTNSFHSQWTCVHLSSICCREVSFRSVQQLKQAFFQRTSYDECSIEYFNRKMFLWW